ncbi:MAG TPA: methionyl-tRNA formyltransferase [Rhizomicrobium sp.]|jgi:methionyl-tRNA formyltransferase|nr:methionyl-tRNA formyltransferase [Rhizomicrobium sp.]
MGLRLVFMGTPDFAVPTLAALIGHGHDIAAVYTKPSRPKGRGLVAEMSPVAKLAAAHGVELRTPETLKDAPAEEAFAELGADAAVVVAYGLLLPKRVLDAPRLGCFNLHASLLPRWRGAAPIQRAIMAGDAETGVMAMRMEEGLDTGPVLMAERVAIDRKTYGELHDELAQLGADLIVRTLAALARGSISEHKQLEDGATYAKKISKDEGRIAWTRPARELDCLVRGLSPQPGAWCEARGERLKILYCDRMEGHGKPGQILDDRLTVACGDGAVRLTCVQRAGRGAVDAAEFLRGFPLHRGEML